MDEVAVSLVHDPSRKVIVKSTWPTLNVLTAAPAMSRRGDVHRTASDPGSVVTSPHENPHFPGDVSSVEPGRLPSTLNDQRLLELMADCVNPHAMFDAFASSAAALQEWHDSSRQGERPPGRLRPLRRLRLSPLARVWAGPLFRVIHDPDGRPRALRRRRAY